MTTTLYKSALLIALAHVLMIFGLALALAFPNPITAFKEYPSPKAPHIEGVAQSTPYWYFKKEDCEATLLIAHGRSHSKSYMSPLIDAVWETSSLCIMAIDLPAHGAQPYETTTIGPREQRGILEALQWLEENHKNPVLIYGVSMGGSATVHALALNKTNSVLGAITDGTYSSLELLVESMRKKLFIPQYIASASGVLVEQWAEYTISEVRPEDLTEHINQPLLVIHGNNDWLAPPVSAQILTERAPNALAFWYEGTHDRPENPTVHTLVVSFAEILFSAPNQSWQEVYMQKNSELFVSPSDKK